MEVRGAPRVGSKGILLEPLGLGGSTPKLGRWADALMDDEHTRIHLCKGLVADCPTSAAHRIIHCDKWRVRSQKDITETWMRKSLRRKGKLADLDSDKEDESEDGQGVSI